MEPVEFFSWISFDKGFKADWALGIAYALVGVAGALVFVYFTFDELLPGMGGAGRLNELETRRNAKESERDEVLKKWKALGEGSADHARLKDIEAAYDRELSSLRKQITGLRSQRTLIGIPLYAVLGGILASALASNLLQAAAIGFGWTGVVQAIGLRRRTDEVKEGSKAQIDSVQEAYQSELDQYRKQSKAERDTEAGQLRAAILALGTTLAGSKSQALQSSSPGESSPNGSPPRGSVPSEVVPAHKGEDGDLARAAGDLMEEISTLVRRLSSTTSVAGQLEKERQ